MDSYHSKNNNSTKTYTGELAVFGTKDEIKKLMATIGKYGIREDKSWNDGVAFTGSYGTDYHIIFRSWMPQLTVHPNRNGFYSGTRTMKISSYNMKEILSTIAKILNKQPLEPEVVTIGGYEVVIVDKNTTKIAGYAFDRKFWEAAIVVSNHVKAAIRIGCNHQFEVDLETIEKILTLMGKQKRKYTFKKKKKK